MEIFLMLVVMVLLYCTSLTHVQITKLEDEVKALKRTMKREDHV